MSELHSVRTINKLETKVETIATGLTEAEVTLNGLQKNCTNLEKMVNHLNDEMNSLKALFSKEIDSLKTQIAELEFKNSTKTKKRSQKL